LWTVVTACLIENFSRYNETEFFNVQSQVYVFYGIPLLLALLLSWQPYLKFYLLIRKSLKTAPFVDSNPFFSSIRDHDINQYGPYAQSSEGLHLHLSCCVNDHRCLVVLCVPLEAMLEVFPALYLRLPQLCN
jgi:hypothetical protein